MGKGTSLIQGLLSKQSRAFDHSIEIANTLLARDYKGFENQSMNGVIECQK